MPVSGPLSDLLKSWGGSVTGRCMVPRGGVVVWATVKCTDMLMQACALSIARVCVIDLYIVLSAGKSGVKVTPLVYAIYFPTIDFFQFLLDNTTISTSYYVNCFFAKKSLIFF